MATNKVLHLEELFQRELADLARDEDLLKEAFGLFAKASSNPVLEELFERIRRDADDLAQKVAELSEKTKETRRDAVRGIIEEGQGRIKDIGDHHLVDVELISTAQRLLGYQVAGYRSVLPITRLLSAGQATFTCEAAVESKGWAIEKLQNIAIHQVHWRVKWWAPEHSSSWDKVKHFFREDWERTKEHMGVASEDEKKEPDSPFDAEEPEFKYGYGAALYHKDLKWNDDTASLLRTEYGGNWDESTQNRVQMGWKYAREGRED